MIMIMRIKRVVIVMIVMRIKRVVIVRMRKTLLMT